MKYIRTKENHIFKIEENITDEEINSKQYAMLYCGEEIINQADDIEDLCDGFIGIATKVYPNRPDIEPYIHYFNKPFEFEYGNNMNRHLKLIDVELKNQNGWEHPTKKWFEDCDIYGFIRTKKGLIYVAKMNEKGELELL